MSIRSTILAVLIPVVAWAGGGIIMRPGNGYTITHGQSASTSVTDPNAAYLAVRYWFDTTNGAAVYWVDDSSGNEYDSAAQSPTWTIVSTNNGVVNYCYDFDGSDDRLVGEDTSTAPWPYTMLPTSTFSVAWWEKIDSVGAFEKVWCINTLPAGTVQQTLLVDSTATTGNQRRYLYQYSAGNYDVINGYSISTGTWIHNVIVHTATTNQWYTNGVYFSGVATTGHVYTPTTNVFLTIGAACSGIGTYTQYIDGQIDDFRFYVNQDIGLSGAQWLATNTIPTAVRETKP